VTNHHLAYLVKLGKVLLYFLTLSCLLHFECFFISKIFPNFESHIILRLIKKPSKNSFDSPSLKLEWNNPITEVFPPF